MKRDKDNEKIIRQKIVTCNPLRGKLSKRTHRLKCNHPNISLNLISVSVLPQNVHWTDVEGFVTRKYGPFRFDFRNANDEIIAEIGFNITYNCKGRYNGADLYLAEVTISPIRIFAKTGYHLTCNVTASNPINFGTKADPIAGVVLKIQMRVKSYLELKSYSNDGLKISKLQNVMPNREEAIEQKDLNVSKDPSSEMGYITNSFSTSTVDNITPSNSSSTSGSKYNVEEQYLNVLVRGDCQTSILSAYGY